MASGATPVYVASKGRPDSTALKRLREQRIPHRVFVEPQDADSYDGDLIVLPENDRGLPYVRQFILDYAREKKLDQYWLLDDDIRTIARAANKKTKPVAWAHALAESEAVIADAPAVGQLGLEYAQFAWAAEHPWVYDSYCDVAVLMRPLPLIDYRPETGVKCDRDYTLQVLAAGYRTVKVSRYCFYAPKNASNRGGLYDQYAAGVEEHDSLTMVRIWGEDICRFQRKKDGRPDVKINWRCFRR